jgi:hypothetical protein
VSSSNAQEQHDITIVNSSLGITRFQLIGKEPGGGAQPRRPLTFRSAGARKWT